MSIRIWPEEAKENNLKHQWDLEGGWEFCLHLVSNVQETFKRRDILPIAVSPVERSQLLLTQKQQQYRSKVETAGVHKIYVT